MYRFSIEKENTPLIKVTVVNEIIEKDAYLKSLIEKCFERIFAMIREEEKSSSSEEADLEYDD